MTKDLDQHAVSQPHTARERRRQKREKKRIQRVERMQARLDALRKNRKEKRQSFVLRMVLLVLALPIFVLICMLAFFLREAELAKGAFEFMQFMAVEGWRASKDDTQAEDELKAAHDDARQIGLQGQGLSIVGPADEVSGAMSTMSRQETPSRMGETPAEDEIL